MDCLHVLTPFITLHQRENCLTLKLFAISWFIIFQTSKSKVTNEVYFYDHLWLKINKLKKAYIYLKKQLSSLNQGSKYTGDKGD